MKIIYKDISEIKEYINNPRLNNETVEYLAMSIKEFGFKVPIIIDKNNVIITGHTRVKAAEQLGLEKIPCIVETDLTEEQIRKFRIVDNKTSEYAKWDFEKLSVELSTTTIDMIGLGFIPEPIPIVKDKVLNRNNSDGLYQNRCPRCGHEW